MHELRLPITPLTNTLDEMIPMSAKKRKKKTRKNYSTGELNLIADSILHPLYRKTELMRLVDGIVHATIERNPKKSVKKFVKYNANAIVKKITGES